MPSLSSSLIYPNCTTPARPDRGLPTAAVFLNQLKNPEQSWNARKLQQQD